MIVAATHDHSETDLEGWIVVDVEVRDKLILKNRGLVIRVVRHYLGRGVDREDLIQEGNLGLLRAATRFDPGRGFRFSTYANFWIRQAIMRAVHAAHWPVSMNEHAVGRMVQFCRMKGRLAEERGYPPTLDEVLDALKPSRTVRATYRMIVMGFSAGVEPDSPSLLREVTMPDVDEDGHSADVIGRALETIDAENRWILVRSFGLDGRESASTAELVVDTGLHLRVVQRRLRDALGRLARALADVGVPL
jgi:RNA polymerase primary sigma factor